MKLALECESNLPSIRADTDMIRRALCNLLDNSIKFTPDGGTVTLEVKREDDCTLRFSVFDTGRGIPEAYRTQIFEKYSQIPQAEGRRRGTGLGLTFCRLVAEAHSGKIWVESRPSGGSIFIFTIKDTQPTPEPAEAVKLP